MFSEKCSVSEYVIYNGMISILKIKSLQGVHQLTFGCKRIIDLNVLLL